VFCLLVIEEESPNVYISLILPTLEVDPHLLQAVFLK